MIELINAYTQDKGKLKVKKNFDGISAGILTDKQKAALKFTVRDSDDKVIAEFTYADMDASGEKTITDLPVGEYTVTETGADKLDGNGYTFIETTYSVEGGKTTVSKNNKAAVTITNRYSYSATGEGEIKVRKELKGRAWTDDDEFTFTLSAPEDTPMPAQTEITITKDDADHTGSFGKIRFTEPGKYIYTVKETKGDIEGVKYDTREHKVTIEVIDDGEGHLIAKEGTEMIRIVKIMNTCKSDKPDTGDDSNLFLCLAMLNASVLGLLILAIRRRLRKA